MSPEIILNLPRKRIPTELTVRQAMSVSLQPCQLFAGLLCFIDFIHSLYTHETAPESFQLWSNR